MWNYHSNQLLHLDIPHSFKIIEFSKMIIVGVEQVLSFLLKIPILEPTTANYFQVLPTPNAQNVVLISPRNFILQINQTQYWTDEECKITDKAILCLHLFETHYCNLDTLINSVVLGCISGKVEINLNLSFFKKSFVHHQNITSVYMTMSVG